MKTPFIKPFAVIGCGVGLLAAMPQESEAKTALRLRDVRTLAIAKLEGDNGFGQRLKAELRALGFRFVDSKRADALVYAHGDWKSGGFSGALTLRSGNGAVLWRETAYRPPNSRVMASTRLTSKLRRALGR
ncbi:MAG TPA: hypothetical protein VF681_15835 [Abditibacteriaceae bacterium]|jgi:hypothetical protein